MKATTVHVTASQLEDFAAESGKSITLHRDKAELRLGGHLFVAPLSIPEQRKGEV